MKKLLLAATLLASPAFAHDGSHDLYCVIKDDHGNVLTYQFAMNTWNSNNTLGTYTEVSFSKNGFVQAAPAGQRPIWIYQGTVSNMWNTLKYRQDQSWSIQVNSGAHSATQAAVTLFHAGYARGWGSCAVNAATASTVDNVTDQGNE
jgi:hypothetical protein